MEQMPQLKNLVVHVGRGMVPVLAAYDASSAVLLRR